MLRTGMRVDQAGPPELHQHQHLQSPASLPIIASVRCLNVLQACKSTQVANDEGPQRPYPSANLALGAPPL